MAHFHVFFLCLFSLTPPPPVQSISCTPKQEKWTWLPSNRLYYMMYDDVTTQDEAHCLCKSLQDARLAIFDDDVSVDDIPSSLSKYHSASDFWVDAWRDISAKKKDFKWSNNCSWPVDPGQPLRETGHDEDAVIIQYDQFQGSWKYKATTSHTDVTYRPLCQKSSAPEYYALTPPSLNWVSLGNVGHMFGFSNERQTLDEARAACSHQAGKVHLATLDNVYDDVAQYVQSNNPDRSHWLDAVITSVYGWATGGGINSSDILPLDNTAKALDSVLLVRLNNSTMKLQPQNRASRHFFICEGSPAPTQNQAASPNPTSLTWTNLGWGKRFAFSDDKKTFLEAKKSCAVQPGSVRLAVLDILFKEVSDEVWLRNSKTAEHIEYWVDAVRAFNDEHTFIWGDGKNIDPTVWGEEKPDDNALVARLIVKHNVTILAPTISSSVEKRYICEEVPDIVLEWRQLGTPPKLFGFSRTASWGLQWAKEACLRQSGDVRLARLDTHLDDVIQVVRNSNFDMAGDTIEFWVDGTLKKKGETLIHWGNGVEVTVKSSRWHPEEPSSNDTNVIIRTKNGETAIAGFDDLVAPFKYICEGIPANTLNEQIQLSAPCTEDDPTTSKFTTSVNVVTSGRKTPPSDLFPTTEEANHVPVNDTATYENFSSTSPSDSHSSTSHSYEEANPVPVNDTATNENFSSTSASDSHSSTSHSYEEANPVPVNDTATNENFSSTSASDSHSSTSHSYGGLLENFTTLTALTPSLDVSTTGADKTMQSAVTSAAEEPSLRVTSEVTQTPLLPHTQTSSEKSFTQNNDAETQSSFTTQNSQGENTATEMRPVDQTSSVDAVTSVGHTNSFNSSRKYFSCSCRCGFAKDLNGNISTEQKIKNIQDNLLLNKKTLSSSKRRLRSASDNRPTAQAAGGCGIVIIVCVVCFIVAPDIASVVFFIVRKMKRESEKEIDA